MEEKTIIRNIEDKSVIKNDEDIVDQKLNKINEIIDSYLISYGINIQPNSEDVSQYFSLTKQQIEKMCAEECDETACLLLQKATQIQMEINKHHRVYNWANENIKAFISDKIEKFGGQYTPSEVKKTIAIQNHTYTNKLYTLARKTKNYLDSLEYLPMCLKNQADFFMNLAKSRRKAN